MIEVRVSAMRVWSDPRPQDAIEVRQYQQQIAKLEQAQLMATWNVARSVLIFAILKIFVG